VHKQIRTDEENRRFLGLQYENAKERFARQDERLYDQILKDLRQMISDNKGFIPAYILSAEIYRKLGKLNDAGRVYGRGFAKTGHVIFLRQMEDLYLGRGEPGVILKMYRRLLEVTPRNQLLMFLYARLCLKLEMIDEAIEILKTLMAEEKEFRGLHRAMAEAYIHRAGSRTRPRSTPRPSPGTTSTFPSIAGTARPPRTNGPTSAIPA
jgi:predicted Zn-dependent protease